MAKKKYYAVKVGKTPGIYSTWSECEEQIKGFPGALYKGFATLDEAEKFILADKVEKTAPENEDITKEIISADEFNAMVNDRITSLNQDEIIAFVDASYDATEEKSAFGAIMISYGGNKDTLYKAFTKKLGEDFIALRNVAAELEGVKEAINWSIACSKKKITVFYDYVFLLNLSFIKK